jgi:putative addiction module component (TIGR02574 family)
MSVTDRARKLREEALALPTEERADLAAELLASLDGEPDEDVERAWAEEIERRARRALADPGGGTDWEVVHQRLLDQLHRDR